MLFTFTQDSTGEEIETRELPDLYAATRRGKELRSFGHVRISYPVPESGALEMADPTLSAPIPTSTKARAGGATPKAAAVATPASVAELRVQLKALEAEEKAAKAAAQKASKKGK